MTLCFCPPDSSRGYLYKNSSGSSTFEVRFADLKQIASVQAGSKVTVAYHAVLNENAVIGVEGNSNKAKLEYSNNPYGDGTGETPEDKVVVFTYELKANKVDKDGEALAGAGFTLYKFDEKANDYVAVGEEITGVTTFSFHGQDAGMYKLVETTVPAGYNKADDIIFTVEAVYDTVSDNPKLKKMVVKSADGNVISRKSISENVDITADNTLFQLEYTVP
ncbi:MAG: isopeptide-forming domain-containing fimbrial protein, partial [Parasporobacterium sp.]|nr:isopeptide-forming domain-containing fimbrial protein [Parasporobacterium sp.]